MGKNFGTDGFRGEANVKLTVEHAYKVGRFLGWYYKNMVTDLRLLSEKILVEAAICLNTLWWQD